MLGALRAGAWAKGPSELAKSSSVGEEGGREPVAGGQQGGERQEAR